MKTDLTEELVGWLSTGAIAFGLGTFLLVWGWLFPLLSGEPALHKHRTPVDPHIALGGGMLLALLGLVLVLWAVLGKLRSRR